MKKLITVFLVLAMIMPAAGYADLPDISSFTNEELLELNHQIQLRLFSEKLIEGIQIPTGVYTVGEDIPEGVYRVEMVDKNYNPMIIINSEGKEKVLDSYLLGDIYGSYEVGKLTLEKGYVIELDYAPVVFFPYSGLFN